MADTVPSGAYFHDSFDGTGDVDAHSPDIGLSGAAWTYPGGFLVCRANVSGGEVVPVTSPGDNAVYYYKRGDNAALTAGGADFEARLRFKPNGAAVARLSIYRAPFSTSWAGFEIQQAGVTIYTASGSANYPFTNPLTNGTTYEAVFTQRAAGIEFNVTGEVDTFTKTDTNDRSIGGVVFASAQAARITTISLTGAAAPPAPPTEFWTDYVNTREVV